MKNKYFLIIFLVMFFLPFINAEAACDYNRQIELNQMASNVKAYYQVSEEPELFFTINIYNITEDIYVIAKTSAGDEKKEIGSFYYDENNKGQDSFIIYTIYQKNIIDLEVYSYGSTCGSSLLRKISIVTPRMNPYYSSSLCQNNPTNSYCQKWSEYDISLEELKILIEKDKHNKINKETDSSKNLLQLIIDFVNNYYLYLGILILAIILVLVIIIKRRKKRII